MTLTEAQREQLVREAFLALRASQAMDSVAGDSPVIAQDIANYVMGNNTADKPTIEKTLLTDPNLRLFYKQLLKASSRSQMGILKAASTDAIVTHRKGEQFSIDIVSSTTGDRMYVVLELDPQLAYADGSDANVFVELGEQINRLDFTNIVANKAQCILAANSDELAALTNPNATVSLV
jgi:hypothetical protein